MTLSLLLTTKTWTCLLSLVAMMANTTLQCELESVSGEDHAQVMRRWVVDETNVEAIDVKVAVVLAGAADKE